jgi:indolepyruvate decarboxylase
MTGMELGHCARHGLDPIVVVLNNRSWGMISAFRPSAHYAHIGQWDFAGIAQGLGGRGYRVETRAQLAAALDGAARARGEFQLLDVRIAPGEISPKLRRFTEAIAAR